MTTQTLPLSAQSIQRPVAGYSTPAIVLAGGVARPDLEAVIGVSVRAMAVVRGKTLLSHIVDGLQGVYGVGEITVVGNVPGAPEYHQEADSGDFVTNIYTGIGRYSKSPYVLVSTSDLPYITSESIASFLDRAIHLAEETGANIVYPIVEVAACYAQFPGIRRTARKLKEGAYTGGNMVVLRPEFMRAQHARIAGAYAARKSPARLASMLGYGTLLRLVLSQTVSPGLLSVSMLEKRASAMLGGTVKALVCTNADIATDLDKPADFAAAGCGSL